MEKEKSTRKPRKLMPISRGSIQHTILEDIGNVLRSVVIPRRLARRAKTSQKVAVCKKVCQHLGYENVILFPYARSAFHAILTSLNLPKNSEILLTPISIGPMLEVIKALGHKPVFVDVELETFCADINDLKVKLQSKPACFLLTYLFGYVPDIETIARICRETGTPLIEDISHNIGASYNGQSLGTFGTAAIYSASLLKYLDAYNGAFIVTKNKVLTKCLKLEISKYQEPDPCRIAKIIQTTLIWNLSLSKIPFSFIIYPLLWLIKKLDREKFEQILGAKIEFFLQEKLPDYYFEDIAYIQCKMISEHLNRLDEKITSRIKKVSAVAEVGKKILGKSLLPELSESESRRRHTFWQFVVPVDNLSNARDALFRRGVETGATNLINLASKSGVDLPSAKKLKENFIFIPIHTEVPSRRYQEIFICLNEITANSKDKNYTCRQE